MRLGSERSGDLIGDIHAVASLVVENDSIPARTHSAVHTQGRRNIPGQISVVAVKACCSSAIRSTSGSSLPRAEALRRIP